MIHKEKIILIAGGSGLIGRELSTFLKGIGYSVRVLSRRMDTLVEDNYYYWNPEKAEMDLRAFDGVNIIINLAGAGIADKFWTKKRKEEIIKSRIESLELLKFAVGEMQKKPEYLISASAIGFYGSRPDEKLNEESLNGTGFLASVCKLWEKGAMEIKNMGIQTVVLRIGLVISEKGGFLPQIIKMLKYKLNIIPGNGLQQLSWIHMSDLLNIFSLILKEKPEDVINAVSPNSIGLEEMQNAIKRYYGIRALNVYVPISVFKFFTRQFSELFLTHQQVVPEMLIRNKFFFQFKSIKDVFDK